MEEKALISLKNAKNSGLKFYFTGKPCKRGHTTDRLVSNRNCYECFMALSSVYRETDREKIRRRDKDYYASNPVPRIRNAKKWATKNKRRRVVITEKYRKANKQFYTEYAALRRANKLKATPKWADLNEIKEIYKNCPKGYHVDHIIPLKGKNVCGLHVEHNLQYLTPKENQSKSNKL